jgi:hypothetical protein
MYSKKILIAAALLLGIASAAQAGGRDDADHNGGFRVGPLGQANAGANPVDHRSLARGAYASTDRVPVETGKNVGHDRDYMTFQDRFADQ